ncbi:MAG: hypothetical protein H7Y12_01765, partial [Sphingobacteriaceae bacterium]|nr:hypothetical protein [Cytophagaceae bacterium]
MKKVRLLVFLAGLGIGSCSKDDFLNGVDTQRLFAPPTQVELDRVQANWAKRDLAVQGYREERKIILNNQQTELRIVSFLVSGQREYGALFIPNSTKPLPVRPFINGFDINNTVNPVSVVSDSMSAGTLSILAIPALRGQSLALTVNGTEYTTPTSGGEHGEAFDGATDDAIAFLNLISATLPVADMARISVRGGSRGGTVALLLAERDKRVKGAIGVACPTDLISLTEANQ